MAEMLAFLGDAMIGTIGRQARLAFERSKAAHPGRWWEQSTAPDEFLRRRGDALATVGRHFGPEAVGRRNYCLQVWLTLPDGSAVLAVTAFAASADQAKRLADSLFDDGAELFGQAAG